MPLVPSTKTVQNVLDRVKRQFGDESGAQLTDSDIIAFINSGQNEINRRNRLIKGTAVTPTVIGTRLYNFPTPNILEIQALHYNGVPLEYRSFNEAQEYIIKDDPLFTKSGTPFMWWEWGTDLYLYYTPDAIGDLTLYYVGFPTDVTAAGDTLGIPDSYYDALISYVLQQAYELDDDWTGSAQKAGQVNDSLNSLAQDEGSYQRGTYQTITIVDEGDYC